MVHTNVFLESRFNVSGRDLPLLFCVWGWEDHFVDVLCLSSPGYALVVLVVWWRDVENEMSLLALGFN